jgi:hypothetical protein
VVFELRLQESGKLVHCYPAESAALAFMRDVVRIGGRDQAARFSLEECDERGERRIIAAGAVLVQRALEDRA